MVGYPQVKKVGEEEQYFNSLCLVSPEGELVVTYQKHFLYTTDENWALEGPSFVCKDVPGLGKVPVIAFFSILFLIIHPLSAAAAADCAAVATCTATCAY